MATDFLLATFAASCVLRVVKTPTRASLFPVAEEMQLVEEAVIFTSAKVARRRGHEAASARDGNRELPRSLAVSHAVSPTPLETRRAGGQENLNNAVDATQGGPP